MWCASYRADSGTGLGGFESAFLKYKLAEGEFIVDYAHNDYLQGLAELGIVGFTIAALFIGSVAVRSGRIALGAVDTRPADSSGDSPDGVLIGMAEMRWAALGLFSVQRSIGAIPDPHWRCGVSICMLKPANGGDAGVDLRNRGRVDAFPSPPAENRGGARRSAGEPGADFPGSRFESVKPGEGNRIEPHFAGEPLSCRCGSRGCRARRYLDNVHSCR